MKWCQACRSVVCRHSGMLFSCCHLRDKIGACQHAPMIAHSLVGVEPYLAIFKEDLGSSDCARLLTHCNSLGVVFLNHELYSGRRYRLAKYQVKITDHH